MIAIPFLKRIFLYISICKNIFKRFFKNLSKVSLLYTGGNGIRLNMFYLFLFKGIII